MSTQAKQFVPTSNVPHVDHLVECPTEKALPVRGKGENPPSISVLVKAEEFITAMSVPDIHNLLNLVGIAVNSPLVPARIGRLTHNASAVGRETHIAYRVWVSAKTEQFTPVFGIPDAYGLIPGPANNPPSVG